MTQHRPTQFPWRQLALTVTAALALAACGSSKPKPAELGPNVAQIAVSQAWTAQIGTVQFPLQPALVGEQLWLASSRGEVVTLEAASGRELGRVSLGVRIEAGVGSDGQRAAVVTDAAQLVVVEAGKELWRRKLGSPSYTPPLVAGGRVFVLSGDRSVRAYDGATGQLLWNQPSRQQDPLVLRQAGVIQAVGNLLVVGQGGRLTALDPDDGRLVWEAPVATPRGTNDVEKLADLVAPVAREDQLLCVRAFQASVGCVDASNGELRWTRRADGASGVAMDDQLLFGTEATDIVQAWSRATGDARWRSERLRYRGLTAPLVIGRSIAVGDATGLVHLLSRTDGSPLNRLSTDGSRIVTPPLRVGSRLVVVTEKGGVFAFQPQ